MPFVLSLLNASALTFGPHAVVYKGSTLADSSGGLAFVGAASVACLLTAVAKSIVYLLPLHLLGLNESSPMLGVCLSVIDCIGLIWFLSSKHALKFDVSSRIIGCGLGWSLTRSLTQHGIPLLLSCWEGEFLLKNLQRSVLSNLDLVSSIALTSVLYLHLRAHRYSEDRHWLTFILLGVLTLGPIVISSIDELNSPQNVTEDLKLIVSWKSLFVETGLSICAALMTLRLYNNSRPTKTD